MQESLTVGITEDQCRLTGARQYVDALQAPWLCFRDGELQTSTTLTTSLGLPKALSGGHSIVVPLRTTDGRCIGIKLFTREVPDREHRYREIAKFLGNSPLAELSQAWHLPFAYAAEGVMVDGVWYPLVKMQWAEGVGLDAWLSDHYSESESVLRVAENFLRLVSDLARLGVAHGDFHHGNILVAPDLTIRLIDYDGMFVPALADLQSAEIGHRNYQSPARRPEHFGAELDRFSAHVLYLSLIAVAKDSTLWEKLHPPGSDYLILQEGDFRNPATSPAFLVLTHHHEQMISAGAAKVKSFLPLSPSSIPPLERFEPVLSSQQVDANQLDQPPPEDWVNEYVSRPALLLSTYRRRRSLGFEGKRSHEAGMAYTYPVVIMASLGAFLALHLAISYCAAWWLSATILFITLCAQVRRNRPELACLREERQAVGKVAASVEEARADLKVLRQQHDEYIRQREALKDALVAQHRELQKRLHRNLAQIERLRSARNEKLQVERTSHYGKVQAVVDKVLAPMRQPWVDEGLKSRAIASAYVPTITRNDVWALARAGISTAADIIDVEATSTSARLVLKNGSTIRIRGIGPSKAHSLKEWRETCIRDLKTNCPIMLPSEQAELIRDRFSTEKYALDARGRDLDDEINVLIEDANSECTHEFEIVSSGLEREISRVDQKRQATEAKIRGAAELAENHSAITRHLGAIRKDARRLSLMRYIYFLFRGH
jgi:hypothetical protein